MKKIYLLAVILMGTLSLAQISITGLNVNYSENFDGMGATGTALPANWSSIRIAGTGTIGVLPIIVGDGSSNSGANYNVGTVSSTDRALGAVSSGSTVPSFGVNFVNNTGNQITEFNLTAIVEQWRSGDSNVTNESMAFSYSIDATSLNSGTWTTVTALDATEILTATATAAATDGNLSANQSSIGATVNISATPCLNGGTLWLRWVDANATGADCLLAIDNFIFKATSSILTNKFSSINGLNIYPNPVSGSTLNIETTANGSKAVAIFDVLGKQVLNVSTDSTTVNVGNLNAGVYIVKITEEGKTATRKLVVR